MSTIEKPMPEASSWSEPFWESTREGKLKIQKCVDCGMYIFYPRLICPGCFSENIEWVETSGKGKIYSFTVVVNNAPTPFLEDMPFVIAIVRLEEGVQMLTNIVGCDPEEVQCDMPVEVTFKKVSEEFTLPLFKPLEA